MLFCPTPPHHSATKSCRLHPLASILEHKPYYTLPLTLHFVYPFVNPSCNGLFSSHQDTTGALPDGPSTALHTHPDWTYLSPESEYLLHPPVIGSTPLSPIPRRLFLIPSEYDNLTI